MRTRSSALSLVALGLFGLSAFSARSALADTSCASDADCVKGWACKVTSPADCDYACPGGQEGCPRPPDCPQDVKSCVPGPCTADSDCATGMVCFTRQVGCDAVPPCAAGADCPTTTCTPTTQSTCIPRYDAPCTVDADCGAGFSCIADAASCACTGGGSAPSADGGAPPPPPPPTTCDCPPATTSSCHALPVTCSTAADCASGWTCEEVDTPSTCVSTPSAPPQPGANGSAGSGATPPAEDAGAAPCPPPPTATKMCLPPYYSLAGGRLGVSESGAGTPTSDSAGSNSTAVPKSPTDANDSAGQSSTAAGCSVAHGARGATGAKGGASGFALFALGLFGFARRRRAERAAR